MTMRNMSSMYSVLLDLIWNQMRSFSFLPLQHTSVTLILLFADVSWCPILPPPNSSATAFPCSFDTTLSWSRSHLLPMNSTGLHVWGVELYDMIHNFDIVVSRRNSRKKNEKNISFKMDPVHRLSTWQINYIDSSFLLTVASSKDWYLSLTSSSDDVSVME